MTKMLVTLAPTAMELLAVERPRLERLAHRLVWDEEDARDVVQAAFADAIARWHTLKDDGAAGAWLRRIVVHRAMTHLRRRRLWDSLTRLLYSEPSASPGPDEEADRRAHLAALAGGLGRLSPKQSTAFGLRYLEGLSIDEVADAMAIDRGTVRVHLQRAVRALRAEGLLTGGE